MNWAYLELGLLYTLVPALFAPSTLSAFTYFLNPVIYPLERLKSNWPSKLPQARGGEIRAVQAPATQFDKPHFCRTIFSKKFCVGKIITGRTIFLLTRWKQNVVYFWRNHCSITFSSKYSKRGTILPHLVIAYLPQWGIILPHLIIAYLPQWGTILPLNLWGVIVPHQGKNGSFRNRVCRRVKHIWLSFPTILSVIIFRIIALWLVLHVTTLTCRKCSYNCQICWTLSTYKMLIY